MIPLIFVSDFDRKPFPLTLLYVQGEQEIEFQSTYATTKNLHNHPGRGSVQPHLVRQGGAVLSQYRLTDCSEEFRKAFWTCAGKIADYFLVFHRYDNESMRGMWFRLVDCLKDVAKLPHNSWQKITPVCNHGEEFADDWESLLDLINDVVKGLLPLSDDVIDMNGLTSRADTYMGGFRSGLKPWEQFLTHGSPGFRVPEQSRGYVQSDLISENENPERKWAVPMGALAIIDGHQKRMRRLREKLAIKAGEDVAEALAYFDSHCLKLDQPATYTSLDGRKTVVRPMQPAGLSKFTPRRDQAPPDAFDEGYLPTLNNTDRYIGQVTTHSQPFEHPLGNDKFQMLSITQSKQDRMDDEQDKRVLNFPSLSEDLFDEWKLPEKSCDMTAFGREV